MLSRGDFNLHSLLYVADEAVKEYLNPNYFTLSEEARKVAEELRLINEFKLTLSLDEKGPYKLNFKAPHFNVIYSLEFDEQDQLIHVIIPKSILGDIPTIQGFKALSFICSLAAELCMKPIFPSKERIGRIKEAVEQDKQVSLGAIFKILYEDGWAVVLKKLAMHVAFDRLVCT